MKQENLHFSQINTVVCIYAKVAVQFLSPSVRICQFAQGSFSLHYLTDYCRTAAAHESFMLYDKQLPRKCVSRGQRLITNLETAHAFSAFIT